MTNLPFTVLPRLATILGIALLALASVDVTSARAQSTDESCAALGAFQQRVEAYAALHRQLAASLPPFGAQSDRHSLAVARTFLGAAIRAARPARQGDIFTPEATSFFRGVLAGASLADDSLLAPLMDEDGRLMPGNHPRIHSPFPTWETRELSASTVFMLPTLPPELEYRVVEYDLVLWDVYADLIVDVLPYAIAHPQNDVMYR
jgi:hypothetical protein